MITKAHLLQSFDNEWVAALESKLDADIILTHGPELPSPAEFTILIAGVPPREHIIAASPLRTLIIPWSGLPAATRELMLEFPNITVYNLHHNAAPAAETAVALMMAAAKKIIPIDRTFRTHDWTPRYKYDGVETGGPILLLGKTALILGFGAIGQHIARACQGLGMKVLGLRKNIPAYSDSPVELYAHKALEKLLPRANVLFVCLPLSPQTRGLIGQKELDLMPDEAIIVNIARGAIIDEKALYETLRDTQRRAGLDVWYNYPKEEIDRTHTPPSQYPFHELDNVVMTPHLGGHSDATEKLRIEALAALLNAIARNEPLPEPVDLSEGY